MTQERNFFKSDGARWRALQMKDARAEGEFLYGVKTTGVYCRPICAAKLARRENVVFFESCAQAEGAGFRACKRCRPLGETQGDRDAGLVKRSCEMIRQSEEIVSLEELSRAVGVSRFYFQRLFKRVVGVSPRQYAMAMRDERARTALREEGSITAAIYAAGFNASSRFYERAKGTLGMEPRKFRQLGSGVKIRYAIAKSALGWVLVAGTERGICCVHFGASRGGLEQYVRKSFARAEFVESDADFETWVATVVKSIEEPSDPNLPLDVRGTAFQHRVWQALREIPAGTTKTYTEIAAGLGKPAAVRAVARACATNPVAVVVPCHRVVRTDGNLAGFRWGLERKRKLLKREAAVQRSNNPG